MADACVAAGAVPRVVDHFRELVHPAFDRVSRAFYYAILRRAPVLWGGAYWLSDQLPVTSPLLFGMNRLGAAKLGKFLREETPDYVISVHPTPAGALSALRARGLTSVPHATVFTDFVAHMQWIHSGVDCYCVSDEGIKNDVLARGVSRERVIVTGIPVVPEFCQPLERATARLALGLSPRTLVLLAMAGSLGSLGGLVVAARVIRDMPIPLQAVIVAGRDGRLAERLQELCAGEVGGRIRVLPYSESVRQLMGAADLLITKAGAVTLAEALAAELPVVCFESLPGQELRNERFVAMAGVALRARSAEELRDVLGLALTEPSVLRNLRAKIREIRRPDAAHAVVQGVLGRGARLAERAS